MFKKRIVKNCKSDDPAQFGSGVRFWVNLFQNIGTRSGSFSWSFKQSYKSRTGYCTFFSLQRNVSIYRVRTILNFKK